MWRRIPRLGLPAAEESKDDGLQQEEPDRQVEDDIPGLQTLLTLGQHANKKGDEET